MTSSMRSLPRVSDSSLLLLVLEAESITALGNLSFKARLTCIGTRMEIQVYPFSFGGPPKNGTLNKCHRHILFFSRLQKMEGAGLPERDAQAHTS